MEPGIVLRSEAEDTQRPSIVLVCLTCVRLSEQTRDGEVLALDLDSCGFVDTPKCHHSTVCTRDESVGSSQLVELDKRRDVLREVWSTILDALFGGHALEKAPNCRSGPYKKETSIHTPPFGTLLPCRDNVYRILSRSFMSAGNPRGK